MKQVLIKKAGLTVPAVVVGCMRQAGFTDRPFSPQEMNTFINIALEHGANFFDHADIYGLGRAESVLAKLSLSSSSIKREYLIIQSSLSSNRSVSILISLLSVLPVSCVLLIFIMMAFSIS